VKSACSVLGASSCRAGAKVVATDVSMAGSPQAGAILCLFGPFKLPAIEFADDLPEAF
jgi:hypothetical protein